MTIADQKTCAPVHIELMEWEGQKILDHLERLLGGSPLPCQARTRWEALGDTFAEAYAAAVWLRENIHLELRVEETLDLLDMLACELNEGEPVPDDPLGSLLSARRKLSDAVRDCSAGLGGTKTPSLSTAC
jgi:hypothetical protein